MDGGLRRRALALYVAALALLGIVADGDGFGELLPTNVESVGTTTIPHLTVPPPIGTVETTTTSSSSSTPTTSASTTAPAAVARLTTPTAAATTAATAPRTTTTAAPSVNCDPNYAGACVPIASDVDCAGGGGNGPAYVSAKDFRVVGRDIYDLDRNGDGVACES